MMRGMARASAVALVVMLGAGLPALAQTGYNQGGGSGKVTGSAGTTGGTGAQSLEKCERPMGAIAVVEPQDYTAQALSRYGLASPSGLIRMMIQQSNCFVVVERGLAMQNVMQERQLAAGGQMRQGSNMGGGQMVAADFLLTPAVVFSEDNAGGGGAAIGGLVGGLVGGGLGQAVGGAIGGGLKFKEAQTSMLLADARSGVQVAAAEGSTRKADLAIGAALFGGGAAGGIGGYGNTNEGKIIAAAFLDNYNKIVNVVRGDPALQRQVGTLAQEAAAGGMAPQGQGMQAGAGAAGAFAMGDVVKPKIDGIKMFMNADESSKVVATLKKGTELVVTGTGRNGLVPVQGTAASGWVKELFVTK